MWAKRRGRSNVLVLQSELPSLNIMLFNVYIEKLRHLYAKQGLALTLRRPASAGLLNAIEAEIGCELDKDLRSAWLEANGGEEWRPVFARPGHLTAYDFLPVEEALRQREGMRQRSPRYANYEDPEPRDSRIRAGWFQLGWLPFASFDGATLLLMQDYAPTSVGRPGQIIAFTHDPDRIQYIAPDFASLLRESLASIIAEGDEFFAGLGE